jgi:pimeloyl-ACP methyl ester carboxylesterase
MARSLDGVEIAYESHGDGAAGAPVVVLVHGWAGNRSYWANQVDVLAARSRVVALDLGGHGESGLGRVDWNLPAFGGDVVAVVDELGAERVALVGHSMGGDAIVYAARDLGDRVVGLVWLDTFRSLGDEPTSTPDDVAGFVAPFRDDFEGAVDRVVHGMLPDGADPALFDRIVADMVGTPREVTLGSIACALNREALLLPALAEVKAPIVAINPDIGSTDADSLRRHGVDQVVMLIGVGHFSMLEDPDQLNAALVEALASFG